MEKERTKSVEKELNVRKGELNKIVKERDTLNENLRKIRTERDGLQTERNGLRRQNQDWFRKHFIFLKLLGKMNAKIFVPISVVKQSFSNIRYVTYHISYNLYVIIYDSHQGRTSETN